MFGLEDLGIRDSGEDRPLGFIADLAVDRLGADMAVLTLLDRGRRCFVVRRAGAGLSRSHVEVELGDGPCHEVVATGRPLALSFSKTVQARCRRLAERDMSAYLGVPISGPAEDVIGVLAALSRTPRIWSLEDRRALDGLAEIAATRILLAAALRTVSELGRDLEEARRSNAR